MTTATDDRFARMKPFNAGRVAHIPARDLPPGPRWPSLLQSIALVRFRHTFVPAMHRRYGDVFTIRIMPKGSALVLFTRPEHTKEIFAGDPEVFHAGKGNAILGPIMGEHSLLLQDSGEHKRARKLLMPAFNGASLRGYASLVTSIAKDEVASWQPGTPFRSLDRMNALTLEVILRVVFGVTDESRLAELRPLVNRTVDINPAVLLGWGYPFLQRFGPWKATVDNQRELDRVMYAEIAERRAATDLDTRTDVLSQLLAVGAADEAAGAVRRRAARPARHAAARRPRDHRDRAVLGAVRARPRPGAARPGAARRRRRATTTTSRRCSRSRCGCTRSSRWWCGT